MSSHIIHRYYRPPEIILMEKEYRESADMWSLGCLLAEMLKCTQPEAEALDSYIFMKGSFCEPISPLFTHDAMSEKEDEKDQLAIILESLGH